MNAYTVKDIEPVRLLREAYGEEVVLHDNGEDSGDFRVMAEFRLGSNHYAVLQNERMKRDDEVALFYIRQDEQGELGLETIEDDEEYENVMELYDEMTVSFDEE